MCRLMLIAVGSFRYHSTRSDEGLKERLVRLAREKPRYGYRGLQVLAEREGERVNPQASVPGVPRSWLMSEAEES